MLKNIYMSLEEGKNLCLILGGRNKFGHVNMSKEEQKAAHKNIRFLSQSPSIFKSGK